MPTEYDYKIAFWFEGAEEPKELQDMIQQGYEKFNRSYERMGNSRRCIIRKARNLSMITDQDINKAKQRFDCEHHIKYCSPTCYRVIDGIYDSWFHGQSSS